MKLNKKTIAVSTASLVIIGGTAFAYLQTTGSGSGTATAGTEARTVELTTHDTSGDLRDDAGVTLKVNAGNTTASTLHYTAPGTPTAEVTGGTGTCNTSDFTVGTPSWDGTASFSLAPNSNAELGTVNVRVTDPDATDVSGCAGATVTLTWAS